MCTAKLYGHSIDTALSVDTRTNTKYWKVRQQWVSRPATSFVNTGQIFKKNETPKYTATATCQQNCHYCSLPQLSVATTIIMLSAHLKVTLMANISVSMCEL